jgi:ABC-2 type transport system permease protein
VSQVARLRPLLRKELRQVRRSRGALLSSTLLPLLLLVISPLGQIAALRAEPNTPPPGFDAVPIAGFADFTAPEQFFLLFVFPMMVSIGGLIVPSVAASYTVIAERERRTIELLVALPVSVGDILVAKLLSMLVLAAVVVLPMYAIDAVYLLVTGLASPAYVALLLILLLCALSCSVAIALLLALLARDLRTANNLNGAFIGPLLMVILVILLTVPGLWRLVVLAVVLLLFGAAVFLAAMKWLTFERYLG